MVLPAPIPLNPAPRMQPYHKPLVVSEETGSNAEVASAIAPATDQRQGPPESFWFSGSLGGLGSLHNQGTSDRYDGDNTLEQPVNNINRPGFRDRVRYRLPKFLSKERPVVRDDGMYTIPPTRYASKARKELQDRPRLPPLSFDGAGDERTSEYLDDRDLPPLPLNPRRQSTNHSITSKNRSTFASLVQRSTTSSKSSFRSLTRDLIHPGRSSSPVDPQAIVDPLNPLKFNPTPSETTTLEMSDP
jgi:hypothetical protein